MKERRLDNSVCSEREGCGRIARHLKRPINDGKIETDGEPGRHQRSTYSSPTISAALNPIASDDARARSIHSSHDMNSSTGDGTGDLGTAKQDRPFYCGITKI